MNSNHSNHSSKQNKNSKHRIKLVGIMVSSKRTHNRVHSTVYRCKALERSECKVRRKVWLKPL